MTGNRLLLRLHCHRVFNLLVSILYACRPYLEVLWLSFHPQMAYLYDGEWCEGFDLWYFRQLTSLIISIPTRGCVAQFEMEHLASWHASTIRLTHPSLEDVSLLLENTDTVGRDDCMLRTIAMQ